MNADFEHIFEDTKKQSLTEAERVGMRNTLHAYMLEHAPRAPLSVRIADALASAADVFGAQRYTRMKLVPATLSLVLVVGVGTAYAAEGALPGDTLYPVKITVNESVQGALALSDSSAATWNTKKIERRLLEAETLIAEGRMTPTAQATLEAQIHATAQDFETRIEKLAQKREEAAVAAAQSDLEASLIGHAEVLLALAVQTGEDTEQAAAPIIRTIIAKAEAAQAARASSEASVVAARNPENVRTAAIQRQNQAKEVVLAVRTKASAALMATTSATEAAEDEAAVVDIAIQNAEEKLRDEDYGSAFSGFQEAIRTAKTIEIQIDASRRLNTDVKALTTVPPPADAALMMTTELLGE